jgi:HD-GYP domain-containing protein (c-di-GMP phosphodiesterase class II)
LRRQLAGMIAVDFLPIDQALASDPAAATVLDVDLHDEAPLKRLKEWLARKPANARAIFITDKASHLEHTRAFALGATDLLYRPVEVRTLLAKLRGGLASLSADPGNPAIQRSPAVAKAVDTLHSIFSAACVGESLSRVEINSSGEAVVGHVETQGLAAWIDTVRTHHSLTYQHCLLVTGLAVAFGQHIGASRADRQRLSFAGMLHDLGKARIPLAFLE